jgi:DNA-binding NarL/FixJ family response regulator
VEDDRELRESVSMFLENAPGFRCIGAFATAEQALKEIPLLLPDVVLMDINLPKMNGIQCVNRLKKILPKLPVLMLTIYENSDQVFEALAVGACGYLIKSARQDKLIQAIRDVHDGGSPMSSNIARKVVQSFLRQDHADPVVERLSQREQEVVELLAKGFPYKQIAAELSMAMGTLHTHIRHIYEKLQVNCRTEAVVKYLGGG